MFDISSRAENRDLYITTIPKLSYSNNTKVFPSKYGIQRESWLALLLTCEQSPKIKRKLYMHSYYICICTLIVLWRYDDMICVNKCSAGDRLNTTYFIIFLQRADLKVCASLVKLLDVSKLHKQQNNIQNKRNKTLAFVYSIWFHIISQMWDTYAQTTNLRIHQAQRLAVWKVSDYSIWICKCNS